MLCTVTSNDDAQSRDIVVKKKFKKRLTILDMQVLVNRSKGKCLSREYQGGVPEFLQDTMRRAAKELCLHPS